MNKTFYSILLVISFCSIAHAQEKTMLAKDFSKDNIFGAFDQIGKEFTVKKDNLYLLARQGSAAYESVIFQKRPDSTTCTHEFCDRKIFPIKHKFVIESIVSPIGKELTQTTSEYVCANYTLWCYYKVKFDDGDISYVKVARFDEASNPINAVARNFPGLFQITPISPNKLWKYYEKSFNKHFKKVGVKEGYSQEDVLKSQWGKPQMKTRSSFNNIDIEIWTYSGGMLTFDDGYVTRITTTQ